MSKFTFSDWLDISHDIAVEHGWWQEERSHDRLIELLHSELSELTEARRLPDGVADKQAKIAEECADFFIRLCDYAVGKNVGKNIDLDTFIKVNDLDKLGISEIVNLDWYNLRKDLLTISSGHYQVSLWYYETIGHYQVPLWYYETMKTRDGLDFSMFAVLFLWIFKYCKQENIDLETAVIKKTERNRQRAFKHGKEY